MYGYFQHFWILIKRKKQAIQENRKFKRNSLIEYPKELITQEQIKLYLKKNYRNLPSKKEWEPILIEMIQEMSSAGWNTEIPLLSENSFGHYQIYVITNDAELRENLTEIISKYEELYDTKK